MVHVKAMHRYGTNFNRGEYTILDNLIVTFIDDFVNRYLFNMTQYMRDVVKSDDYSFKLIIGKDNVRMMLCIEDAIVGTSEIEFDNFIIPTSLQCFVEGDKEAIKEQMEIFVCIASVNIIEDTFVKIPSDVNVSK